MDTKVNSKVDTNVDTKALCDICFFRVKNCICQSFWKNFDSELVNLGVYASLTPSPLSISTMTFGMKLKDTVIDLDKLAAGYKRSLFTRATNFRKGSKKSKKDEVLNYQFYNQCSITSYIPDERYEDKLIKVSTKIFNNGSLNFTGVKNIRCIVHMVRYMILYLSGIEGVLTTKGKLKITDAKISMINTDYKLGLRVRQKVLNQVLQNYSSHIKMSTFEPGKYNGVKINFICDPTNRTNVKMTRKGVEKVYGEITISVFNTGNIIITGGNTIKDTMFAYRWMNNFFEESKDLVLREFPADYKPKKKTSRVYYREEILKGIMSDNKNDLFVDHQSKMEETFAKLVL
jgi:TATA-box binding protein (TBP) (component of TFIID and TFIIIB)